MDPVIYLAPTLILSNMATQGPRLGRGLVKDDGKDRVAPDVEFSLNVCHLYKPQVQLNASIRMVEYLQSLPLEKDERLCLTRNENKDMTEGSAPFSLDVHSTRQLCHFKLLLVNFISTLLSSNRLVAQLVELDETEKPSLEKIYQKLVETALEYTQSVSRQVDLPLKVTSAEQGPNPKFWRALLHRSYDVIDRYFLNWILCFPFFDTDGFVLYFTGLIVCYPDPCLSRWCTLCCLTLYRRFDVVPWNY